METADQLHREKELFERALDLASAEERLTFLQAACGADTALLERLQALLHAHESDAGFLPDKPGGHLSFLELSEKPGDRIGRYKLREKIGEGGCGVVYVAEQEEPVRRKVALKVIKLGMDTRNVVARFDAERQALALMDHPNIAKVLEAGATETGRPYFVMELVRGVKITDYCDQNQLSTRERLELFIKVCQAVQHAHQKGIIHRDLKPSNILVTVNDGVAVPKVIDFGIAKATEGRLTDLTVYTDLHQFIGTPAYMSPEQAVMTSLDIDTRSDIYSLGVLLYELLTGHTPFETKELMALGVEALRRTIREKEPVRPSTRLSTMLAGELTTTARQRASEPPRLIHLVRGDLDWIVLKCLEKDRARRYETANGLAFDVKRHLDNEPVVARPPSTAYRFQKAWRRHKLALTATTAVAMALMAGIGISIWQAVEATRAQTDAVQAKAKAIAAQKEAEGAKQAETGMRREAEHQLYAAKMNLVQQAWDQNNLGQLRQLLEETQDSPYKGFEYYYWQPKTHLALKTLRGHMGGVLTVAFSPDGHRIATGGWDDTAKVWDVASGKELLTFERHSQAVCSLAFSPDGQRIITGSWDQTAKVWEAASGQERLTLKGHTGQIWAAAYSPDGQRIVTGSADRTARVWDADSGKGLLTLKEQSGEVYCVAFSPDGQRIVTGSADRTARVWDADSGKQLLTLKEQSGEVYCVAYSPDGQRIVTGSTDRAAKVWEAASGRELLTLTGHDGQIWAAAFSPDGRLIVTGSTDQSAKVWEAASGRELLTFKGHGSDITSVAFSPDGQRIVTGSSDTTANVWDVASGLSADPTARNPTTLKGNGSWIWSVAISPDGQRIVAASEDKTAKVWEAVSGRELLTLTGHSERITSVVFSSDGRWIVTGSWDGTVRVWDAVSGRELRILGEHRGLNSSVAISPDSKRVVAGFEEQRVVAGTGNNTVKMWDAATGKNLLTLKGHSNWIKSVAFSPDGQRIVTGSNDQTAKVWDAASGRELLTLKGHGFGSVCAAYSPDSQRIVTGSQDRTAMVWDAASGKDLLALKGHSGGIWSVTFSPDGQRIVTGSEDNTAKVWEAATGRELLTLKGHNGAVRSVAFSPDGQRIVTGGYDQTARVWEAARAGQVADWQVEERAAAGQLAARQRERRVEQERNKVIYVRSSIKNWLVLAPIPLPAGQSGAEGLENEQIEGEGLLRPKAGDPRFVGGKELRWREVALETYEQYIIDFNALLGQVTEHGVAYAVCYLRSESDQRGIQLRVGSEDEAKVYLNGKQVYKAPIPHGSVAVKDTVPGLTLNAGMNVLVFKVVNETGAWAGSIQITDSQGNPVEGITVTLDPEAKR